ncbi:MAG: radical SAM protein [Desulfurococcales archaeon]|nr:radical SAM protein [Desulfurococcales archaeon]
MSLDIDGSCSDIGCWIGKLPKGCELCMEGLKSVVFITGICRENCFYCPISPARRGKDLMYVNDVLVSNIKDIICEVVASGSKGIGLTGGDPLVRLERTINTIKLLKDFFGSGFHVHLYTTGLLLTDDVMNKLVNAGLDEIRIHVVNDYSWRALKTALRYPISVGIENPVLPKMFENLKELVIKAHNMGVEFINLNELEFSEGNYLSLRLRGFKPKPGSVAAEGSEDLAIRLLEWVKGSGLNVNVHYCPAVFKDKYQYVKRLKRRALNTKLVFEAVDEGLVRWASISSCPESVLNKLVLSDQAFIIGNEVVTSIKVARALGCRYYVVEALPLTPRKVLNKF